MNGQRSATIAGEDLVLLPGRAIWWPARSTLLVADVHLGKGASFRAGGVPVPEAPTRHDLGRLSTLLINTGASRLVILGDFLHAAAGRQPATMEAAAGWRARHRDVAVLLVRGNHDERAGDPPDDWRIDAVDGPLVDGPFVYRHEPEPSTLGFVLAGHLHPAVVLDGPGAQSLRTACFWFSETSRVGVLPAFGSFTGCTVFRTKRGDRVFAVGSEEVIELDSEPAVTNSPGS